LVGVEDRATSTMPSLSKRSCLFEGLSRQRRRFMKFQQSCGAEKGRPRALRLTVAALGALLMPGIGWRDGVLRFLVWAISAALRPRALLIAENVCLRHQLGVLQRRHRQPRLRNGDRQFWICASRWFAGWRNSLLIVKPETVLRWHRRGWRAYWSWRSNRGRRRGRRPISRELQALIRG
jgi:heme exporter protein D